MGSQKFRREFCPSGNLNPSTSRRTVQRSNHYTISQASVVGLFMLTGWFVWRWTCQCMWTALHYSVIDTPVHCFWDFYTHVEPECAVWNFLVLKLAVFMNIMQRKYPTQKSDNETTLFLLVMMQTLMGRFWRFIWGSIIAISNSVSIYQLLLVAQL